MAPRLSDSTTTSAPIPKSQTTRHATASTAATENSDVTYPELLQLEAVEAGSLQQVIGEVDACDGDSLAFKGTLICSLRDQLTKSSKEYQKTCSRGSIHGGIE